MLKTAVSCFIFCLGILMEHAHSQGTQDSEKISRYFRDRCRTNGKGDEDFNNLERSINAFSGYMVNAAELIPNDMNTFCDPYRKRRELLIRINELSNALKPCLFRNEEFLPSFVNTTLSEFIHFLCHNDGKYSRRFFSSQNEKCREALLSNQEAEVSLCFNKMFAPRTGSVTKGELCSNINIAKECISRNLDKTCSNSKTYQDLNNKLFEYISKPCSACSTYLSGIPLMMYKLDIYGEFYKLNLQFCYNYKYTNMNARLVKIIISLIDRFSQRKLNFEKRDSTADS
ncbi:hypothetical protein NQ317_017643 [Molorchus minor]|uniref:Uncharacterized protein n=1 Tax=Molorchus minor TaxID=1323400 RepID=A0ABQ9JMG5_9CUCU|nr:hypothetical protein NQ317_017643 [Molorchus minor]